MLKHGAIDLFFTTFPLRDIFFVSHTDSIKEFEYFVSLDMFRVDW